MVVLSLFDGISCGMVALERAGIQVDKYYASEIDKYATSISKHNYSNIIRLGDINNWKEWDIEQPDIIIGGSPCQGFSLAGKQLNFEDERSKLFFKFVDILNHYKPKYFLLENVKMKKEYSDVISQYLGVDYIEINSSLLSAQNRVRRYWTNIPNVVQPEDKHIYLKDVLEETVEDKYFLSDKLIKGFYERKGDWASRFKPIRHKDTDYSKSPCLTARYYKMGSSDPYIQYDTSRRIGIIGKGGQGQRIYDVDGKSVSLSALGGGQGAKTGLYAIAMRGRNNKNNDKIEQKLETSYNEKANCLTSVQKDSLVLNSYNYKIRKLTPIECERLQTLNDDYTRYGIIDDKITEISNSQRYKCLGNGWTVDIISHILKNINK